MCVGRYPAFKAQICWRGWTTLLLLLGSAISHSPGTGFLHLVIRVFVPSVSEEQGISKEIADEKSCVCVGGGALRKFI